MGIIALTASSTPPEHKWRETMPWQWVDLLGTSTTSDVQCVHFMTTWHVSTDCTHKIESNASVNVVTRM